jgi:hypothetical protein
MKRSEEMTKNTGMGLRVLSKISVVALLVVGGLSITAGALGATTEGCGTYSYGFTGTRLLNDAISTSAGPFTIALPAGTYDITMHSNDNHPSATYQTEQTQEQWFFELDSGYVSSPTDDIPDDQTTMITTIKNAQIDASTAITVKHLEQGAINSVNVECIGFTPSEVAIAGPATTSTVAEVAAPTTVEPAKTVSSDTTAAPTTDAAVTTVPTVVKAKVEVAPVAQLAVTGARSTAMILFGFVLVGLGLSGVLIEQGVRRATSRT